MAAESMAAAVCSALMTPKFNPPAKPFSRPFKTTHDLFAWKKGKLQRFRFSANLGGGDGEAKKDGKRKFITKDEEPEQYWQTAGEREGENPMSTPLPYIIIFGMSTPFVILAIAFANGWIKVPVR
ncbi:uncharacterized protein [Primulina huaijiensis]|uniref:uncharacterized protein n=1 Tax=Primulina huaijiensis TaxID=1492673 RepID=UPI003CC73D8D